MKNLLCIMLLLGVLSACSNFKENVGLVKNQPDEYQVVTNPDLSVPPNFNIYSPEEIAAQKSKQSKAKDDNFTKGENYILDTMNKQEQE
jgi:hypothetical protein